MYISVVGATKRIINILRGVTHFAQHKHSLKPRPAPHDIHPDRPEGTLLESSTKLSNYFKEKKAKKESNAAELETRCGKLPREPELLRSVILVVTTLDPPRFLLPKAHSHCGCQSLQHQQHKH
ncbi:hypothetical protein AOLI_G00259680 [Acnodon oligacanthus]